jgi:hypothetical protein
MFLRSGSFAALVAGAILWNAGCATTGSVTTAQNGLLAQLMKEDQASRTGDSVARSDEDRIQLVLKEIGTGHVRTPEDQFNSALVLDHSPMTFRNERLVAKSPHDYLLAHFLAKAAFERGNQNARQLVAQTIDRYLSMTAGYQKYGTNRFINQKTGQEELAPIDRNTTDAERAVYGIQPLAELLKQYPEAPRSPPPR